MIVCPVCEHPQAQGFECEVCGKQLVPSRQIALAVAPLPELEQTQFGLGDAPVPVIALPDLELTRVDSSAPVPPAPPMPELDLMRADAMDVPVQSLPELEGHRLAELTPAERTAAPTGAAVCRYCRNVQAEGAICDRCGMRLPRLVARSGAGAGQQSNEDHPIVLHACGGRTRAGETCSSCGAFVPLPD